MKSSLQYTLILYTRTQNLNQKLLRDNGTCKAAKDRALARVPAGSYKTLQAHFVCSTSPDLRLGLQLIKGFFHRRKIQWFQAGLKGAAC